MLEYALQSEFVSVAFHRQPPCARIIWTAAWLQMKQLGSKSDERLSGSSPALSAGLTALFRHSAALMKLLSFQTGAGSRPAQQLRIRLQRPAQKVPQLVLLGWEQGQ